MWICAANRPSDSSPSHPDRLLSAKMLSLKKLSQSHLQLFRLVLVLEVVVLSGNDAGYLAQNYPALSASAAQPDTF